MEAIGSAHESRTSQDCRLKLRHYIFANHLRTFIIILAWAWYYSLFFVFNEVCVRVLVQLRWLAVLGRMVKPDFLTLLASYFPGPGFYFYRFEYFEGVSLHIIVGYHFLHHALFTYLPGPKEVALGLTTSEGL